VAKRKKGKAAGQIQHARLRADQRYGLRLSEEAIRQIANVIGSGGHKGTKDCDFAERRRFVCTISNRLSVWRVLSSGNWVVVAYDKLRHNIATVLPPDWTPDWREKAEGREEG
jgi:hypothetical protein